MKTNRARLVAYWTATILGPASFVIGGILHLTLSEQVISGLHHLGYPAYFAILLGVAKLCGAIVTVIPGTPRLKEWAYAGFFFNLTAAAFSHAAVGDAAPEVVAPLVFLALVLASWALRPDDRRLGAITFQVPGNRNASAPSMRLAHAASSCLASRSSL